MQFVRQRQARSEHHDFGPAVQSAPAVWQGTQRGLLAMRDLLAARGIPLVVAVFPMLSQLEPELYPCRAVHRLVVDFCGQQGIRCLDLLDPFLGQSDHDLWVHPSDQHPNHIGHRLLAERIHTYLAAEHLLPGR